MTLENFVADYSSYSTTAETFRDHRRDPSPGAGRNAGRGGLHAGGEDDRIAVVVAAAVAGAGGRSPNSSGSRRRGGSSVRSAVTSTRRQGETNSNRLKKNL